MRSETTEALTRLVTIYVTLIERAGADVSEKTVATLATDPLAACEALNEQAVKVRALTPEADAVIAAIYESLDAADARSGADEKCLAEVANAWATSHVERPVPEPEPESEPAPAPEAAPEEPSNNEAASDDEKAEKPKRRRTRKPKKSEEASEQAQDATADKSDTEKASHEGNAQQDKPAEPVDTKPGHRSRAKAKAKKAEKPAEATAENHAEQQAADSETPREAAPAQAQAAAPAADDLTVDQTVAILGVSRPTVYKLIESGELPAYKKGRSWRISAEAVSKRAAK